MTRSWLRKERKQRAQQGTQRQDSCYAHTTAHEVDEHECSGHATAPGARLASRHGESKLRCHW
eukprot:3189175-Amphidinium_carterae.1